MVAFLSGSLSLKQVLVRRSVRGHRGLAGRAEEAHSPRSRKRHGGAEALRMAIHLGCSFLAPKTNLPTFWQGMVRLNQGLEGFPGGGGALQLRCIREGRLLLTPTGPVLHIQRRRRQQGAQQGARQGAGHGRKRTKVQKSVRSDTNLKLS